MRLIDADAIFNGKLLMVRAEAYDAVHAVIEKINNAPTVDAVEVVRCKDCKWRKPINSEVRGFYKNCMRHEIAVYDDGFCAWGERRADGDND